MSETIPATEVKNRFGQIIRQAQLTGEPIFVEKRGRRVAVILSIESYEQLQPTAVSAEARLKAEAAFGLWAERQDLDDDWLKAGQGQWQSRWSQGDESITEAL